MKKTQNITIVAPEISKNFHVERFFDSGPSWGPKSSRFPSDISRMDVWLQASLFSSWQTNIVMATTLMFWVFSSEVVYNPETTKNRTAVLGPPVIRVRLSLEGFGQDLKSFSCKGSPTPSQIDEVTADWKNRQSKYIQYQSTFYQYLFTFLFSFAML